MGLLGGFKGLDSLCGSSFEALGILALLLFELDEKILAVWVTGYFYRFRRA
jgi:hypothetical protein